MNRGRVETFSRKVSPKGINVNRFQFRKHGTVKPNIVTSRVISLNVIGKILEPIVLAKSNMCTNILSMYSSHWLIILGVGIKVPSEVGDHQGKHSTII